MTTTDLRPSRRPDAPASTAPAVTRGPFQRIVVGSLAFGAVAAAGLTLGVFPGAVEHVTTGVALLAFAAGWAVLAALTTRMTNRPQRWAYVPAAFLAAAGLALTVGRIGRCHPWCAGGLDPVPPSPPRLFTVLLKPGRRATPSRASSDPTS